MSDPVDPPPTRPRRWRRRLLFVLAQLVLLALLLEGGARLVFWAMDRPRGMGYDADLGWRLLPDVTKKDPSWCAEVAARTNRRGWRDDDHALAKPPGMRRIVALGDSQVFGQAVDFGDRFSEVLEELIERCEVINLGVPGWGTDQELIAWRVEGVRYDPEVVVLVAYLGNDLNDIRNEYHWRWPKPWFRLEEGRLELVPPEPDLGVRIRSASYVGEMISRVLTRPGADSRAAPPWREADTLPLFCSLIEQLRSEVRARDAHLLTVLLYSRRETVWRREIEDRVLAALAPRDLSVLDALPALVAAYQDGRDPWFQTDNHLNPAGHRLLAELIAARLAAEGWLR
jgi:lysophospholipase L1-like esterase